MFPPQRFVLLVCFLTGTEIAGQGDGVQLPPLEGHFTAVTPSLGQVFMPRRLRDFKSFGAAVEFGSLVLHLCRYPL